MVGRRKNSIALAELRSSRAREGEKLVAMLRERVGLIRERVAVAAPIVPTAVAEYREKLTTRLREAVASLERAGRAMDALVQRGDASPDDTDHLTLLIGLGEGYSSIGCTHCTAKGKDRCGRWIGKPKTECGLHL